MTAWTVIGLLTLLVIVLPLACALLAFDEPAAGDLDHMTEAQRAKVIPLRRTR